MLLTRDAFFLGRTAAGAGIAALLLAASLAPAAAQEAKQKPAEQPAAEAQPAPAEGESAQGAQPEWIKLCSENPENKQQVCVVTRERRAATGQLLAAVSIREVEKKKILVTAVPPGMLLRPGLQVQIDGGKTQKAQYTICFPNLCFAENEVTEDYLASLKKGSQLVITTLNQQAKPVNFDISLAGFTTAYDGPAIDPAQLQAEQQKLQDELKRKAEEARKQLIEKQRQPQQSAQ